MKTRALISALALIAALCMPDASAAAEELLPEGSVISIFIGEPEGSRGDTVLRSFCRYLGDSLRVMIAPVQISGTRAAHLALSRLVRADDASTAMGELITPNVITDIRNPAVRGGVIKWRSDVRAICRISVDPAVVAVSAKFASRPDAASVIGACGEGSVSDTAARKIMASRPSRMTIVRCGSPAEAIDLLARGEIDMFADCASRFADSPLPKGVRVVSALADERSILFPDAPSSRELSSDITAGETRGIAVSPSMPRELLTMIRESAARIAKDPRFAKELRDHGYQLGYLDMEDYEKELDRELDAFAPVAVSLGW